MKSPSDYNFPSIYLQLAKDLAKAEPISFSEVLQIIDVSPEIVDDPNACIDGEQLKSLLTYALKQPVEAEPLSFKILRKFKLNSMGALSMAAISGETVMEGGAIVGSYYKYFMPPLSLTTTTDEQNLNIYFDMDTHFGDAHQTLVEVTMGAFDFTQGMFNMNFPRECNFAFKPLYSKDIYEEFYGCPVKFGCDRNKISISKDFLKKTIPTANANAKSFLCQELKDRADRSKVKREVTERIKKILHESITAGEISSKEIVAGEMAMSPRTLTRKLSTEGTTYQAIHDEIRFVVAKDLLYQGSLSVAKVASHIGYDNEISFNRAFKKWSGLTPKEFKQRD